MKFTNDVNKIAFETNPIEIEEKPQSRHFWGDLHGQSEETIGTNSAEAYFKFARDLAFVDVSESGNDFQITTDFWKHLDEL